MKTHIALLVAALVAAMNLGAQEPPHEPAANAPAAEWNTWFTQKNPVPVSSNLAAYVAATLEKPSLSDDEITVLNQVGFYLLGADHSSALGQSIRAKLASTPGALAALYSKILSITLAATSAEILELATGDPDPQVAMHVGTQARLHNDPGLFDAYCETVVGMGVSDLGYGQWFKKHISSLSTAEKIAALGAEIAALLEQPQSPQRDALLVEFRGQRLVLKELQ